MLTPQLIEAAVRFEVGPGPLLWLHDRTAKSPMNIVLDIVDQLLAHPVQVVWVGSGLPRVYADTRFTPALVVFSGSYVELAGTLHGLMGGEKFSPEILMDISRRASLRIIAEMTLEHGDAAVACHMFVTALLGETIHTSLASLVDIEASPLNEAYITIWFFALTHEIGHVHADSQSADFYPVSDSYLENRIEQIIRATFGTNADRVLAEIGDGARGSSIDRAVLMKELDADQFSAQTLIRAAIRVMEANGNLNEFSAGTMAAEIVKMFRIFHYLNSCSIAAQSSVYDAPLEWSVDPWRNIANGVRLNAIIDFLAQYISRAGDPAKAPDERSAMKLRRQLIELVSDRAPHASAFNDGHAKAVRESMFPAERQANVFIRLAEQISTNGTDEAVFRVQARRFLALATKLGIEHPDIDLLAAMYNQPKQSLGIVGGHQEVYSLGWLSGRGRNEPLGLQARDARVVFVYLNTDRADLFLDLARSIVADDVELTKVGFISTTQHEVLTMVHRELMHKSDGGGEFVNSRVQVVFEGSEAFERRVGELANGSFWPSDD